MHYKSEQKSDAFMEEKNLSTWSYSTVNISPRAGSQVAAVVINNRDPSVTGGSKFA